tara:strand:- start:1276 stop:2031 length:756 start_codon:yes stop_codon:yes gene_type:complete
MLLEDVIVGSCIHALLKSYLEGIPVVLVDHEIPPVDMTFDHPIQIETLNTLEVGDAWSMLKFLCSMRGLIVNPDSLDFLRIEKNSIGFKGTSIEFKKCHLFPSQSIRADLDIRKIEHEDLYKTMDFMRLKFCNVTNIDTIFPEESFVKMIRCFGKKEVVAVCNLTKEQLTNFDYSDTIVRFVSQKELLKDERLHRPITRGESRRNPNLEVIERRVIPLEEVVYRNNKKVKYYDRQKRDDILKTYRRDNSSI